MLDFLNNNDITFDDLANTWDLRQYLDLMHVLRESELNAPDELLTFIELLAEIEFDKDLERENALEETINEIATALAEWDSSNGYSVSKRIFDVVSDGIFLDEVYNYSDITEDLICVIKPHQVTLSNGSKLYKLTEEEYEYIPFLFKQFSKSRIRMSNNLHVIDLFRNHYIENPRGFVEFVAELYHVIADKPNREMEELGGYRDYINLDLDKNFFTLLLEVYENKENALILEAVKGLAPDWCGNGVELVESAIVLTRN